MSIQSEVDRIGTAKNAIRNAIEAKGVSVPSNASIDDYAEKISEISYSPTYQIAVPNPDLHDVAIPNSAKAGEIIFTAKNKITGTYYIYQGTGPEGNEEKGFICEARTVRVEQIDRQADVVKQAYANLPETMAPPPTADGRCSWFIMPACNVYINVA